MLYSRVNRELLKMAPSCLVVEVSGVDGEKKSVQDSTLLGPGIADRSVQHTVVQSDSPQSRRSAST